MDVDDAVDEERKIIEESRNMQNHMVQTLRDNKVATPLLSPTCSRFHHASYTHENYAFATSRMCNEEEPISFEEAHSSEN